jgi:hypothetical protein
MVAFLLVVIAVLAGLAWREIRQARREAAVHAALETFGHARANVLSDPRQLLAWYPIAQAARKLDPAAFAALDAATGGTFPFAREHVERAHAKVSTEWLAWERAHDEEYRLKQVAAEQEIAASTGEAATLARARLDRVQHEKIERYQQRYEEYIRTAKALQALLEAEQKQAASELKRPAEQKGD